MAARMSSCFCFGAGASGAAMSVSVLFSVGLGDAFYSGVFWGGAISPALGFCFAFPQAARPFGERGLVFLALPG